jgi:hypothetical protein
MHTTHMVYNGLWALECSNSKQPWHWDSLALAMAVLNIQQQTIALDSVTILYLCFFTSSISHLIVSRVRQLQMFERGASHTRSHVGGGPATGWHKPALGQGPTLLSFAVLTSCSFAVLQVCFLCFYRQSVVVDSSSPAQPSPAQQEEQPT